MKDFVNRLKPTVVAEKKQVVAHVAIVHGPTLQELSESLDSLRVELAEQGIPVESVKLSIAHTAEAPRQLVAKIVREETDEEFGRRKDRYDKDDAAYRAWRKEYKKQVEDHEKAAKREKFDALQAKKDALREELQELQTEQDEL